MELGKCFIHIIDCYACNKIDFARMYLICHGKANIKHIL